MEREGERERKPGKFGGITRQLLLTRNTREQSAGNLPYMCLVYLGLYEAVSLPAAIIPPIVWPDFNVLTKKKMNTP